MIATFATPVVGVTALVGCGFGVGVAAIGVVGMLAAAAETQTHSEQTRMSLAQPRICDLLERPRNQGQIR